MDFESHGVAGGAGAHRDAGDAWVQSPDGAGRYWGRYGAAGLLLFDPAARSVLLQLRATWSHFGDTWGIPGGAIHEGEAAVDAALRESGEEASVPAGAVDVVTTRVLDLGFWSYTTVIATLVHPFDALVDDHESTALAWVGLSAVTALPLHPGLAEAWPRHAELLSELGDAFWADAPRA